MLPFPAKDPDLDLLEELEDVDLDAMDAGELRGLLARVEALYADLEGEEPQDEDSEEYETWMEELEELDDMMDEIHERLEEME